MAIKVDKTGKVPENLVDAAIRASEDYDDDKNRKTIGTYTEERMARVVYAVLKELKKSSV